MTSIRAFVLKQYGGPEAAVISTVPAPEAGPNQVLVRVAAAGINGLDWKVREGYVRDAFPLELPAILGIELAGIVERVGPGASRFQVGDRVMGGLGRLGAYAELVASQDREELLFQTYTTGVGHCNLTGPQILTAVNAIDLWVRTGVRPTSALFPAVLGFNQAFVPPPF